MKLRKRNVSLYCTVISTGQLVIARMPEHLVRWDLIQRELRASIKREHGIKARDIHVIEAFAGSPDGDTDSGQGMAICERAYAGCRETLKSFAIHAWDEQTKTFKMVRAPVN